MHSADTCLLFVVDHHPDGSIGVHYITICVSSIRHRTLMWLSGTFNSVEINILFKTSNL